MDDLWKDILIKLYTIITFYNKNNNNKNYGKKKSYKV